MFYLSIDIISFSIHTHIKTFLSKSFSEILNLWEISDLALVAECLQLSICCLSSERNIPGVLPLLGGKGGGELSDSH